MYNAIDVADYIIYYCNKINSPVSNLKLHKLLYFIQAHFLTTEHRKCFKDAIMAYGWGPVVQNVNKKYNVYGGASIFTNNHDAGDKIEEKDKQKINNVIDYFSNYSSADLLDLCQSQDPWKNAYNCHTYNAISIESMMKYFNDVHYNRDSKIETSKEENKEENEEKYEEDKRIVYTETF